MLYIFDKDKTLVSGPDNRPANTPDEQTPLPGVVKKLAELRAAGHKIAIASNQGGVAWGFISEMQAQELVRDAAEKVGGVDLWDFCPHDPRRDNFICQCRKPRPGMLIHIMRELGYLAANPSDIVMIGDSDTDKQAAESAGVRFEWAADFFGWKR